MTDPAGYCAVCGGQFTPSERRSPDAIHWTIEGDVHAACPHECDDNPGVFWVPGSPS